MSDYNINNMDFKQLRNKVQLLRDELALFKRKYEDIIYNLDDDNFSSRLVKEKGDMKTAIEITAEGLESKVSNEEFESTITQVSNEINLSVSALDQEISSLSISTSGIRSRVGSLEEGKYGKYTLFEQTADGFKLTGDVKITEIAQVGGDLYIGDYTTSEEKKHIYFNSRASISNALSGFGYDGLEISAACLYLMRPDQIYLTNPENTSVDISLADYVSENGGGTGGSGGTAVAVFG